MQGIVWIVAVRNLPYNVTPLFTLNPATHIQKCPQSVPLVSMCVYILVLYVCMLMRALLVHNKYNGSIWIDNLIFEDDNIQPYKQKCTS